MVKGSVLLWVAMLLVAALSSADVSSTPSLPTLPSVLGAEVEYTINNATFTFVTYEKIDMNKQKSKLVAQMRGQQITIFMDWATKQQHVIDPERGCVDVSGRFNEDAFFALSSAMMALKSSTPTFLRADEIRGIQVNIWAASNVHIVAGSVSGTLNIQWYFTIPAWDVLLADGPQLVQVRLFGELSGVGFTSSDTTITITDVNPPRALADDTFDLPSDCTATSTPPSVSPGNGTPAESIINNPMPTFPDSFYAVVETNMREAQKTFTLYHWFSGPLAAARTLWVRPSLDAFQRQERHEIYLIGAFQLAYELVTLVVPQGLSAYFNPNERQMFFPDSITCTKNVFNMEIVTSVNDILLRSAAPGARYMGKTTVRGMAAKHWQAVAAEFRVSWYFLDNETWGYSSTNGTVLLRMVVQGSGKTPMFVFHPFFQTGEVLLDNMTHACDYFVGGYLPDCSTEEQHYQHVHEFLSFDPTVDSTTFHLPSQCLNLVEINAVPVAGNCDNGLTSFSVFLLCLASAVVAAFLTVACIRLRKKKEPPASTAFG